MFDKRCRAGVERGLRPVGSGLERVGITANQLTVLGLVLSAASALAIANGWLVAGAALLALSAVPDVLDGAVAKASGTASPRGAFFDSVVDRVSDTLVLGGVAWYLASVDGGHAAILPLAVLGASNLVSYERARAESLGFSARGGLMERAERMIAVGVGLLLSAVLVPVLWLMLVLTLVTAVHRFVMVWRQGTPRDPTETLLARWRARRPESGYRPGAGSGNGRWRSSRRLDRRSPAGRRGPGR
ncbi:MAG TPA: CDP-alcohol phosphatidyltransferase family protein [Acidimicrobiales bacterium]|nr:CDP-alcohol phosphatidyltransferase family protein [Acidimicrobiales bacterium]